MCYYFPTLKCDKVIGVGPRVSRLLQISSEFSDVQICRQKATSATILALKRDCHVETKL